MNDYVLFEHFVENGYRDAALRLAEESAAKLDVSGLTDDSTCAVVQRFRELVLLEDDIDGSICHVQEKLFPLQQPATKANARRQDEIVYVLRYQRVLDLIRTGSPVEVVLESARTHLLP